MAGSAGAGALARDRALERGRGGVEIARYVQGPAQRAERVDPEVDRRGPARIRDPGENFVAVSARRLAVAGDDLHLGELLRHQESGQVVRAARAFVDRQRLAEPRDRFADVAPVIVAQPEIGERARGRRRVRRQGPSLELQSFEERRLAVVEPTEIDLDPADRSEQLAAQPRFARQLLARPLDAPAQELRGPRVPRLGELRIRGTEDVEKETVDRRRGRRLAPGPLRLPERGDNAGRGHGGHQRGRRDRTATARHQLAQSVVV